MDFSAFSTNRHATVFDVTEKAGEISVRARKEHPNAAPKESVDAARERVEALGIEWHKAIADANLSRNTGYTLLRGTGSIGSLRILEEWLVKQEAKRPRKPPTVEGKLGEWAKLGEQLLHYDPERFDEFVEVLRELVRAKALEESALARIKRPNSR